jgi:hypothetical protein
MHLRILSIYNSQSTYYCGKQVYKWARILEMKRILVLNLCLKKGNNLLFASFVMFNRLYDETLHCTILFIP